MKKMLFVFLAIALFIGTCFSADAISAINHEKKISNLNNSITIVVKVVEKDSGTPINRAEVTLYYGPVLDPSHDTKYTTVSGTVTFYGDYYTGLINSVHILAQKPWNYYWSDEYVSGADLAKGGYKEVTIELRKVGGDSQSKNIPLNLKTLNLLEKFNEILKLRAM